MERIGALFPQQAVRPHGHRYGGALHGDTDIREVEFLQQGRVAQGALRQGLAGRAAVFFQQLLLQGAAVDADADGDLSLPAGVRHGLHPVLAPDVAWVDADLVDPLGGAGQGQLIVEVDVRHQGDMDLALDSPDGLGRRHVRHRHADDLAPRLFKAQNLSDAIFYVARFNLRHALHGNMSAADQKTADAHRFQTHTISRNLISFFLHHLLQFRHKGGYIFKGTVYGSVTHICDFVELL